jgi:hypothetical protein
MTFPAASATLASLTAGRLPWTSGAALVRALVVRVTSRLRELNAALFGLKTTLIDNQCRLRGVGLSTNSCDNPSQHQG